MSRQGMVVHWSAAWKQALDARDAQRVRAETAESEMAKLETRVAELQGVVDAYAQQGHTVCVKAGEHGEVDMWTDGHAHAMAPLSSSRARTSAVVMGGFRGYAPGPTSGSI